MSSEVHRARLGVRRSGGGPRGARSRSVQACATASRETGRPVRREPHRPAPRPAGGRAAGGPVAGVVVGAVTRVTCDAEPSLVGAPQKRGRRRAGVRLTRRGRIVLTCGWTMIAGVVLWIAVLLTG